MLSTSTDKLSHCRYRRVALTSAELRTEVSGSPLSVAYIVNELASSAKYKGDILCRARQACASTSRYVVVDLDIAKAGF